MTLLESITVPMGTPASDFSLMGVDDKTYSLSDFEGKKVFVLIFMCNHCPYVQAIWDRLVSLQEKYAASGVQFVGINPNFHPDYPEDSLEKMKEYHDEYKMNFPYLQDKSQDVAREYKAQCTPDIFVYNEERKLAYHGRLDDNWQNPGEVSREELDGAISTLLKGESPAEEQNPSMGCSVKWR